MFGFLICDITTDLSRKPHDQMFERNVSLGMLSEHILERSNISVDDMIQASLDNCSSDALKNMLLLSKGATAAQLRWSILIENQKKLKDDEMMQRYTEGMSFERFLSNFESKIYGMLCLSKLMLRYLRAQPIINDPIRAKLWLIMTKTDKSMKLAPNYYNSLKSAFKTSFKEFSEIIDLDVRRTPAAVDDPDHHNKLTNILTAYAK